MAGGLSGFEGAFPSTDIGGQLYRVGDDSSVSLQDYSDAAHWGRLRALLRWKELGSNGDEAADAGMQDR